jgi:hypothetical protein
MKALHLRRNEKTLTLKNTTSLNAQTKRWTVDLLTLTTRNWMKVSLRKNLKQEAR